MKTLIKNFPQQLEAAINIGQQATLTPVEDEIRNIVVAGLGGSGIGGDLAKQWLAQKLAIPMEVQKDYFLPAYVNQYTLLIISSYSGNTEETIHALEEGLRKRAKIVCITSGGKIKAVAEKKQLDHILLPGGMPSRSCLGYSVVQQLFVIHFYQSIQWDFVAELAASIQLLTKEQGAIQAAAQQLATKLKDKLPIIYTAAPYEAVAIRFRQQLNENSKKLCWHHIFPEMNHNELVGWRDRNEQLAVVMLRNTSDYPSLQARMEFSKKIFQPHTSTILELYAKGSTQLARSFYLIHLCDWASYYLAQHYGVDPTEVAVIEQLKASLERLD